MMLFRKNGLDAVAAPTNHIFKNTPYHFHLENYFPSGQNIRKMEMVIHEFAGMVVGFF
jgi:hypothetical protein